jgi:hypothetical protein
MSTTRRIRRGESTLVVRAHNFSELVTCIVINLDSRPDRWRRVSRMCRLHRITAHRFSAHDRERGRLEFPDSALSPAELGLWSSIVTAVRQPVDSEWILILEDDAILLPRFRRHVLQEIENAGKEALAIRLGWVGRFIWKAQLNFFGYVIRLPKRVAEAATSRVRIGPLKKIQPIQPRFVGAHAFLLRRAAVDQILEALGPGDDPPDVAFLRAEKITPNVFVRSPRNRAWQWPDRSDIHADWLARTHRDSSGQR